MQIPTVIKPHSHPHCTGQQHSSFLYHGYTATQDHSVHTHTYTHTLDQSKTVHIFCSVVGPPYLSRLYTLDYCQISSQSRQAFLKSNSISLGHTKLDLPSNKTSHPWEIQREQQKKPYKEARVQTMYKMFVQILQ